MTELPARCPGNPELPDHAPILALLLSQLAALRNRFLPLPDRLLDHATQHTCTVRCDSLLALPGVVYRLGPRCDAKLVVRARENAAAPAPAARTSISLVRARALHFAPLSLPPSLRGEPLKLLLKLSACLLPVLLPLPSDPRTDPKVMKPTAMMTTKRPGQQNNWGGGVTIILCPPSMPADRGAHLLEGGGRAAGDGGQDGRGGLDGPPGPTGP